MKPEELAREIQRAGRDWDAVDWMDAARQLAQMVIEQEKDLKAIYEQAARGCMCLIDEEDNIINHCGLHAGELDQVKQEQREKDAKIDE